jgi:hypothetical protein
VVVHIGANRERGVATGVPVRRRGLTEQQARKPPIYTKLAAHWHGSLTTSVGSPLPLLPGRSRGKEFSLRPRPAFRES